MFDLVADVEKYPEFLPLCESLSIITRLDSEPQTVLDARMGVGYKAIHETFTSRVTLNPAGPAILVEYLDGPFKRLENRWRFVDVPSASGGRGASDTDFYISYEFKSPILGLLVGGAFDQAFRKFAEAFEMRARKVYGEPTAPSA